MNPFPTPKTSEGPFMSSDDNWVSFTFVTDGGYDKLQGTVHGSAEFVAEKFGIEDFDGKVSTLMKRAIFVDSKFKSWYRDAEGDRPKA